MKSIDKTMQWVEGNTNLFITILFGIIWSLVIYSAYLILTGEQQ